MITKFLFVAVVLFFVFRFLQLLHRFFNYPKTIKYHVSYIIPSAELFSWIGLWIWMVGYFYLNEKYKFLVLLAIAFTLAVVPSFFLLRNFVFGVYLKIQRKFDKGDFIEFDNFEGEIVQSGNFNLDIKDAQGDIKSIPYSKLKSEIITKHGANPNLKKQMLLFHFPVEIKTKDLQHRVLQQVLNSPWVAISQPPFVESIKNENNTHIVEVAVFTLKNEHAGYIQEMVERNMLL